MRCELMHKNISVADVEINEDGSIVKLRNLRDWRRLPIEAWIYGKLFSLTDFSNWRYGRSIPERRPRLKEALHKMDAASPVSLTDKCFGLSLSDQYWFRPEGVEVCWDSVNFFTNGFSNDAGDILLGREPSGADFFSPDNTTDGWLPKRWIIADGKRYLMKAGSGAFRQEPFNEVIASLLAERLGISHTKYSLTFDDKTPYSLCENFITPDTELIPAYQVIRAVKKSNQDSFLKHLLRCCDKFGIKDAQASIDRMIALDYIIANEDRHYNNFGFIRDAETLRWRGFAPVYDCGTSLWFSAARIGEVVGSLPFRSKHEEQIKLAKDLSWFDITKLDGIEDEIIEILLKSPDIGKWRPDAVAREIVRRAERLESRRARK